MRRTADAVVIGGGIVGSAIAHALAAKRLCVTLLERGEPASRASGSTFAWINATGTSAEAYHRLRRRAVEAFDSLEETLRRPFGLRDGGSLHWATYPDEAETLRQRETRLRAWGYPVQWLDAEALSELEPHLQLLDPPLGILYAPMDKRVDARALVGAFLARAKELGAEVVNRCPVIGLRFSGDRVTGVETPHGTVEAPWVVCAAGVEVPKVARMVGLKVPVKRSPGLLVVTAPVREGIGRVLYPPGFHMRPTEDGRLILGAEDVDETASEGMALDPPPKACRQLFERAAALVPSLRGRRIEAVQLGIRPIPADGYPLIGPAPGRRGIYIAVMHSGITLAPLVGKQVAREIVEGEADPMLAFYRLGRLRAWR